MARKHPLRALLVFPSASLTFMAGSIGELTALIRAAESSRDGTFQWRYLELVGGPDVILRSQRLMASVDCKPLLKARDWTDLDNTLVSTVQRRFEHMLRFRPDVVVLSSFRAFLQFPRFPGLIAALFEFLDQRQIPVMILDPCGDSYLFPTLLNHPSLLPVPFTYPSPQQPHQRTFSSIVSPRKKPPACDGEWLWLAAPWMRGFHRFRIAERIALTLLAGLGVPVTTLAALEDPRIWCPGCSVMKEEMSFLKLDRAIARKVAVVTANARSVLAARAASWGVPVIVSDPTRLPSKRMAKACGVSPEELELAEREHIPEFPVPTEAIVLPRERRQALEALRQVQQNETGDLAVRRERRRAYEGYPSFTQVLAEFV